MGFKTFCGVSFDFFRLLAYYRFTAQNVQFFEWVMGFCLLSICLDTSLNSSKNSWTSIFFEELIRLTTLSDAYYFFFLSFFCVLEFPRLLFFSLAILWNKQTKINNQPLPLGGDASN